MDQYNLIHLYTGLLFSEKKKRTVNHAKTWMDLRYVLLRLKGQSISLHTVWFQVIWQPRKGKTTGEGNGTPLQYSCLETPMDGGA